MHVQLSAAAAAWICPEWCSEEWRARNLIKGEYHYSAWEMAGGANGSGRWPLRLSMKDTGVAILFHIILYDLVWDSNCRRRSEATTFPTHTHTHSPTHTMQYHFIDYTLFLPSLGANSPHPIPRSLWLRTFSLQWQPLTLRCPAFLVGSSFRFYLYLFTSMCDPGTHGFTPQL